MLNATPRAKPGNSNLNSYKQTQLTKGGVEVNSLETGGCRSEPVLSRKVKGLASTMSTGKSKELQTSLRSKSDAGNLHMPTRVTDI